MTRRPWFAAVPLCRIACAIACGCFASCASSNEDTATTATADSPAAAHDAVQARIDALIGDPTCDADAQCHTIAVGAHACGGPTIYRAWSEKVTRDVDGLEQASQAERALAMQIDREAGRMSPCLYLADPGAQCVRGRCETRTSTPRPASP
jgi:hypothetical protein